MSVAHWVIIAGVVCGGACTAREVAVAHVELTDHREPARRILEQHCGLCHLPGAPDGIVNPDAGFRVAGGIATHIFDLRHDDWSATLSDAQLDEAVRKLSDDGAGADEMRAFEGFVADEMLWRDAHAADYPQRDRPL